MRPVERNATMKLSALILTLAASLVATAGPAAGQAERSLERCHKEASKRTAKHEATLVKTLAKCFQKVSKELIKDNEVDVSGAARSCSSQLRKIINSEKPTKTLEAKTRARIDKRCEPALNAHTENQVLSLTPSGVAEGIEAANLEAYCISFGGDGTFDSVDDWIECQMRAAECQARMQVGTQFPRILEWLPLIEAEILALGPDQKYLDAAQVLSDLENALDGNDDLEMDLNCGPGITDCGNGVVDVDEQCDGVDLDGESCISLGFANGGDLTCLGNCAFNLSSCFSGTFPKTGQTVTYQNDDDGDLEIGPDFAYTDNGDGTVTDGNTGLTWEKYGDDGGMHDQNLLGNGNHACARHLARVNFTRDDLEGMPAFANDLALMTSCTTDADCVGIGNGLCGHAGFQDWRMPNRHEMHSIVNIGNASPAISSAFNDNCVLGCNVKDCSCTVDTPHWTSTTREASTTQAWVVIFEHGIMEPQAKTVTRHVRAVRGP